MIKRVTTVGIAGNILLAAFKLIAGLIGNSGAMISDAVHSMSDVAATFIAWLGVRYSEKEADENHRYGHERFECLASIALGLILIITGIGIGISGIRTIASGACVRPEAIALVAAAVSIVTKEAMFWYTRHCAKIMNSSAFMADAWHHRSDALSSVGSLIGIGGAMLGLPIMDPIAALIICLMILKVGVGIISEAFEKMMDTSAGEEIEKNMGDFIESVEGVENLDLLMTRKFGNRIYADIEFAADGDLSLREAHEIATKVHDGIENQFPEVKHVMVHVNPVSKN